MEQTQLKNRIARRELGGCSLFCGEEDYLKRRFRDDIRAAVLGDGAFAAFDHAVFDGSDVSVADVLDALLSKRHYKEAYSLEKTKEIMSAEYGKQFDPVVLAALLDNWDEFVELYRKKRPEQTA